MLVCYDSEEECVDPVFVQGRRSKPYVQKTSAEAGPHSSEAIRICSHVGSKILVQRAVTCGPAREPSDKHSEHVSEHVNVKSIPDVKLNLELHIVKCNIV